MAESEEELKNLLIRVKEESEKNGLKLNIKKTKIMATGPVISWQIEGEDIEAVTDFTLVVVGFSGSLAMFWRLLSSEDAGHRDWWNVRKNNLQNTAKGKECWQNNSVP